MKSLLEPVELNRETTQALDEIRSGAENPLFGAGSADAEEKIYRLVLPLIEGSGMPSHYVIHYRWFLREIARLWRTREGRDLAFHLELSIRKWTNLGLESRTLQFLVSEAHQRLKAGPTPVANRQSPTAQTQSASSAATASEPSTPRTLDPSVPSASAESVEEAPKPADAGDSDEGRDWMEGLA